jgi:hypothetical protein
MIATLVDRVEDPDDEELDDVEDEVDVCDGAGADPAAAEILAVHADPVGLVAQIAFAAP